MNQRAQREDFNRRMALKALQARRGERPTSNLPKKARQLFRSEKTDEDLKEMAGVG